MTRKIMHISVSPEVAAAIDSVADVECRTVSNTAYALLLEALTARGIMRTKSRNGRKSKAAR